MLKLAHMERFLRLQNQIRELRRSRPKAGLLHLSCSGCSCPQKSMRETAYLMQLRLHLETELETGPQCRTLGRTPHPGAQQPAIHRSPSG